MIIQSSNVAMASRRTYEATRITAYRSSRGGNNLRSVSGTASTLPQAKDGGQRSTKKSISITTGSTVKQKRLFQTARSGWEYHGRNKAGYGIFKNLLELLLGERTEPDHDGLRSFFNDTIQGNSWSGRFGSLSGVFAGIHPTQQWGGSYVENTYYEEKEETAFYSSGTVKTADGRSLEFDISAVMSRSFQEYTSVQIDYQAASLVDPLVINLDVGSAEVSEQKFLFDIDADGEMDNISMLSEVCGFLALDKNGDGVINDGSELFGPATGNGFAELAVYDTDGNGWIDENDAIFNKLRIWTKDANGRDKLVGLGVAGVGAIYLGNLSTDFDIKNPHSNETAAQIRSTGIYLKETGEVGTIQHVDMAVQK